MSSTPPLTPVHRTDWEKQKEGSLVQLELRSAQSPHSAALSPSPLLPFSPPPSAPPTRGHVVTTRSIILLPDVGYPTSNLRETILFEVRNSAPSHSLSPTHTATLLGPNISYPLTYRPGFLEVGLGLKSQVSMMRKVQPRGAERVSPRTEGVQPQHPWIFLFLSSPCPACLTG